MKINIESKRRDYVRNLRRNGVHTKADLYDFTGKPWQAKSSGTSKQVASDRRLKVRAKRHACKLTLHLVKRGSFDPDQPIAT